ncbi:glycosyltransferase [uncultured Shewanella sp.]|uniref:glycosyltransferase family 2 protein n=1 Tax=uncultured Shewanella sp. TaxID=173975 RepID=UPI0026223485|nr:glycosyltransferase [uncultured Shewanella sp.]
MNDIYYFISMWIYVPVNNFELLVMAFPLFILIELPFLILIFIGVLKWFKLSHKNDGDDFPTISVIVTCYSEGDAIRTTIDTLVEQYYPNDIEIILVIDGVKQNIETYKTALFYKKKYKNRSMRKIKVLPKWYRGGRVSALNAGLFEAKNQLVINVDADTSFDNNMAYEMALAFSDQNVIASGGALRVRNENKNFLTKLQSIEYMLSMRLGKIGMSEWGVINNISGAFGAFRREMLKTIGGWDTHTAEDLDLTVRLKQYKRRYPFYKLCFSSNSIGHTDVPDTVMSLIKQRLRWDGDLLFLYLRKHKIGLTVKLLGWGNLIFLYIYGIFQNVALPFMIIFYLLFLLVTYPFVVVLSLTLFLYLIYLFTCSIYFCTYLLLVSEKKNIDIYLCLWLPLFPIYQFIMKLLSAFAMSNEIFRRSHEESNMAPWWVIKRGKRF